MHRGEVIFNIIIAFLITWIIALSLPVLTRYVILRRPVSWFIAIALSTFFWFINIGIFTALGSQSKSHGALALAWLVSSWILQSRQRMRASQREQKSLMSHIFTTNGRMNRKIFIWVQICLVIPATIVLLFMLFERNAVTIALFVGICILSVFPVVQRWHDLNKSGLYYLLGLIPVFNIIPSFFLFFVKGTDGPNRYGYDPLKSVSEQMPKSACPPSPMLSPKIINQSEPSIYNKKDVSVLAYCIYCGVPHSADAAYCAKCGKKI